MKLSALRKSTTGVSLLAGLGLVAGALFATPVASAADYTTISGSGAYSVPETAVEDGTITISGTGWKTQDGSLGSVIAVKWDDGASVSRKTPATHPVSGNPIGNTTVWEVVKADDTTGNWSITLDLPTAANANFGAGAKSWAVGTSHQIVLLTGSLIANDTVRSTGLDDLNPNSFTIVTAPTDPTDPTDPTGNSTEVTLNVEVAGAGGLALNVANDSVDLGQAVLNTDIDAYAASGFLPDVTVTDTRGANPGWSLVGKASDFNGTAGAKIAAKYLGWTPAVVSTGTGQVVNAGAAVAAGTGFAGGATLASATAGNGLGTAKVGAELNFAAPTTTTPGAYTSTITLTLS